MTTLTLGPLVGAGVRSHVFALDEGRVVKVPHLGTPDSWMRREAEYTTMVHALGLPVPAVLDLTTHDGRTVVVYQRVHGPSMWSVVVARPQEAEAMGGTLADLHLELLARPAQVMLPRQRDRLLCKLRAGGERFGADIQPRAQRLADSAAPMSLCHGDLHPGNVIMAPSGPVVLDWFDAGRGEPLADVARSSILMGAGGRLDGPLLHLVPPDRSALARVHDTYLGEMRSRLQRFDDDAFADWLRIGAAARLAEGVGSGDLLSLLAEPGPEPGPGH